MKNIFPDPSIPEILAWVGRAYLPPFIRAPQEPTMTHYQRTYEDAYKAATADGERHEGAHHRGLEAVYNAGKSAAARHPFREMLARELRALAQMVSP